MAINNNLLVKYCIDTSTILKAWNESYRIINFPSFWQHFNDCIYQGLFISPMEVFFEIRDKDLIEYLKIRKSALFFKESPELQRELRQLLAKYPEILKDYKKTYSADSWVIALGKLTNTTIISEEEEPDQKSKKLKIPNVCAKLNIRCLKISDMVTELDWKI